MCLFFFILYHTVYYTYSRYVWLVGKEGWSALSAAKNFLLKVRLLLGESHLLPATSFYQLQTITTAIIHIARVYKCNML